MSVRRFMGDRVVAMTDWERERFARREAQTPAVDQAKPPEPEPVPPNGITCHLPGGDSITVFTADVRKRLPLLEALGEELTDQRIPVWQIVHARESAAGSRLRGLVARDSGGQVHVFMNAMTLPCPVLRVHTLRHELEHLLRHDLDSPLGWDAHMESRCNEAADRATESMLGIIARKCSPGVPPLNVAACLDCARNGGGCQQDPRTFADLQTRVPY